MGAGKSKAARNPISQQYYGPQNYGYNSYGPQNYGYQPYGSQYGYNRTPHYSYVATQYVERPVYVPPRPVVQTVVYPSVVLPPSPPPQPIVFPQPVPIVPLQPRPILHSPINRYPF
jgi:hypothetical protein